MWNLTLLIVQHKIEIVFFFFAKDSRSAVILGLIGRRRIAGTVFHRAPDECLNILIFRVLPVCKFDTFAGQTISAKLILSSGRFNVEWRRFRLVPQLVSLTASAVRRRLYLHPSDRFVHWLSQLIFSEGPKQMFLIKEQPGWTSPRPPPTTTTTFNAHFARSTPWEPQGAPFPVWNETKGKSFASIAAVLIKTEDRRRLEASRPKKVEYVFIPSVHRVTHSARFQHHIVTICCDVSAFLVKCQMTTAAVLLCNLIQLFSL